jgi:hypothetical protein
MALERAHPVAGDPQPPVPTPQPPQPPAPPTPVPEPPPQPDEPPVPTAVIDSGRSVAWRIATNAARRWLAVACGRRD